MERDRHNQEYGRILSEALEKIRNFEISQGWKRFLEIYRRGKHGDAWMDHPQVAIWEHVLVAFVLMFIAFVGISVFAIIAIWDAITLAFSEDGIFREVWMLPGIPFKLIQPMILVHGLIASIITTICIISILIIPVGVIWAAIKLTFSGKLECFQINLYKY